MVYCPTCGVQAEEGSLFCHNCGQKLDEAQYQPAKNLDQNYQPSVVQPQQTPQKPQYVNDPNYAYQQSNYQNPTQQPYTVQSNYNDSTYNQYDNQQYNRPQGFYQEEDKINPLLYILSFFIFPLGLVLYFANKQQKPRSAKNVLITTIIGFFIIFVV